MVRLVWDLVREQRGRIWLEFLPAYAPELNPVEYPWLRWKQHELPNFRPKEFWGTESLCPEGTATDAPQS